MKFLLLSLMAIALCGCATDETAAEKQQQSKANAATGAGSGVLTNSGVNNIDSDGDNPLNPPPSDFSIDL